MEVVIPQFTLHWRFLLISCPKCGATLPQAVEECQFCGRDVTRLYRPADHSQRITAVNESSGLVWFWYIVVALLWIVDGVFHFASGIGLVSSGLSGVSLAIGSFMTVVGIGFLTRNEVFRSHYLPLCFLALVAGVWTAIEGTRVASYDANLGYLICAIGAVRALSAGVMTRLADKSITTLAR
jgi:hypothetical protein